ncbi:MULTISPECIES: hypothetical protein [Roseobacteraceae]|uniref:hypothetical protein n=1 Tax=Roseobacteraceae TaxID=2854170 RepID=UPI0031D6C925
MGYALTLNSEAGWYAFSHIVAARLSIAERAALAFSVLSSMPTAQTATICRAVLPGELGAPISPLIGSIDESRWWSSFADECELDAYAVASVHAMQPDRRREFIDFVTGLFE